MTELEDLARQYLDQHYFIGHDGLLYTPGGRAARSTIRFGRKVYPAAHLVAEMRRQNTVDPYRAAQVIRQSRESGNPCG